MTMLILQGPALAVAAARELATELHGTLDIRDTHIRLAAPRRPEPSDLSAWRDRYGFDINLLPVDFNPEAVRLLISDMDSTLINIECMDEIADFLGIKAQVAEITESAMRGEIDFETSLRRRIALVKGVDTSILQHVYDERLDLNPGAETLIAGLRRRGIKTALVSGGFTFFTEPLRRRLALDYTLANELDLEDGRITGRVADPVIGADAKAGFLLKLCRELEIRPQQAVAVGDGANDLKMMREAGLSVAYRAKPAVQAEADVALNHAGLDAILNFIE